jgi:hypothetical protein
MSQFDEKLVGNYFDDGLPGVKSRVCKGVAESLRNSSPSDDPEVEKVVGLPTGILNKIRNNEELNGEFTSNTIQRLAACCRLDLVELFHVRDNLSNAEKSTIFEAARNEEFIAFAATGDPEWSEEDRIDLFLVTTALRQLDNSECS